MFCNYCMIWYVGKSVQNVCASQKWREISWKIMSYLRLSPTSQQRHKCATRCRSLRAPHVLWTSSPREGLRKRQRFSVAQLRWTIEGSYGSNRGPWAPDAKAPAIAAAMVCLAGKCLSAGSAMPLTNSAERPVASVVHAPTSTSPRKSHRKRPLVVII